MLRRVFAAPRQTLYTAFTDDGATTASAASAAPARSSAA
jgi:hypothetical protein